MNGITVGELLEQLKMLDPNIPCQVEGCDCIGVCSGTVVEKHWEDGYEYVLLLRKGGYQRAA